VRYLFSDDAFALQGSKSTCADFDADFFAVNDKCLFLKVWFPDFFGVALRETDIIAELLPFATDFTYFHDI
jgi:hypothetical protein